MSLARYRLDLPSLIITSSPRRHRPPIALFKRNTINNNNNSNNNKTLIPYKSRKQPTETLTFLLSRSVLLWWTMMRIFVKMR